MAPGLLTDLYQLTMAQGYFHHSRQRRGVFELFFRRAPFGGGFAVAAGLDPAVDALAALRFSAGELEYLANLGLFGDDFLRFLESWRFGGAVHMVAEGTPMFAGEPLLRVTGLLTEAQLVETMLLNLVNFQTLVATKAARVVQAAGDKPVLEFGLRRAQGPDAGMAASRAAYLGGAAGTSNVAAGMRHTIPVRGTMAHAWVQAFADESEAFARFAELYPEQAILLIDTYDTLGAGIEAAIPVLARLHAGGHGGYGVRLDSGDLGALSLAVRARLDAAGLPAARVVASGDLDEERIAELEAGAAPIDAYGVGTRLSTAHPDAALTGVYKLVAVDDAAGQLQPTAKLAKDERGKSTVGGVKQVLRRHHGTRAVGDVICTEPEVAALTAGAAPGERFEPLLHQVLAAGQRLQPVPPLSAARERCRDGLQTLAPAVRRLQDPHPYPVTYSTALGGDG